MGMLIRPGWRRPQARAIWAGLTAWRAATARKAGASVKTVPGIYNLLGNRTWKPELKDLSIDDLLRREPVTLDQSSLQLILEDAVVIITGGGGA